MVKITETVDLEVADGIAVLTVNNPPVNALGHDVRQGLDQGIRLAAANDEVTVVVIAATGRTFPAGADIREFGQTPKAPFLPDVCQLIEDCPKPVIAALHGTTLGGGLEVALASHYRIALESTRLGLPEVTLGILPGAGGTQRLPRLVGAGPALDIMLSGKPVTAQKAFELGLVDQLCDEDLRVAALGFAQKIAADSSPACRTRDRVDGLADADAFNAVIAARRARLTKSAKGQLAPFKIVDCVEASARLSFDDGIEFERNAFLQCLASDQSKGMIHAFFAERQTAKIPELAISKPRPFDQLAVIGGGTMGAGIAVAILNAGLSVLMIERDNENLARGRANVEKVYDRNIAKGRMSDADKAAILTRFSGSTDYGDLAQSDLVIEAVFEQIEVKKAVFAQLDQSMKPGAVLATNTSYLDINMLAATISRPQDVIGLHFFSPANIMKLLEIVVPEDVSPDVVATAFALAKRLGKTPVRAGVCDGFIGNRILAMYRRAIDYMMEDGASPYQIDAALRDFGFPMGPFQVSDLAGGDIGYATRKRLAPSRDSAQRYVQIADRICERGWFGQKTGRGYYIYENGARIGTEDPEILGIIDEERQRANISPRLFSATEIQDRYMTAMINEGCNVLADGIALRPLDIDVILLYGYGFPRWRGGPMKYADMIGPEVILARINDYAKEDAQFWQASPLLVEMVKNGQTFDDLNKSKRGG